MSVIDTSFYIALVNAAEPGHVAARQWFQSALKNNDHLIAPVIMLPEAGAAISRGLDNNILAQRVVQNIHRLSMLELVPVDDELAASAAEIAIECRIRGCDAVFVALAQRRSEPLVTFDKQQRERSPASVTVIEPH